MKWRQIFAFGLQIIPNLNQLRIEGPNLELDFNQLVLNFRLISEIKYFLRLEYFYLASYESQANATKWVTWDPVVFVDCNLFKMAH